MRCDIIIPVWNQPVFTKDCIDSVLENTDIDYRLVIIDNASEDKTRLYLEGLKGVGKPPVALMRNERNLGFVKAANQGIRCASAPYVCILNNDTRVTKNWLREMIGVAESAGDIGIVNPSSNNLGQKPARGEPIALYAAALERESGAFIELGAAVGFCMLIKRAVLDEIGLFDEIYGMGNFEDTDFSRRAVKKGYRCVRARGAYVWHRESSSFNGIKTFEEDFRRNRAIYEARWGAPRRIAYVLDSDDAAMRLRFQGESMGLARDGNWVWFFSRNPIDTVPHSNIRHVRLAGRWFFLRALFAIVKKKKKFDEVCVGSGRFGRVLRRFSFIHKARVKVCDQDG